jgi:hypothetical protein
LAVGKLGQHFLQVVLEFGYSGVGVSVGRGIHSYRGTSLDAIQDTASKCQRINIPFTHTLVLKERLVAAG